MPSVCSFKRCKNRGGHFFPKDPVIVEKWLTAIGRPGFEPSIHSRVCSAHFRQSDFVTEGFHTGLPLSKKILKKGAVPSVFPLERPLDGSGQCYYEPEAVPVSSTLVTPGKRKLAEPINQLCTKSSKVILLIQDPSDGRSIADVEGASVVEFVAGLEKGPQDIDPYSSPRSADESDETERQSYVESQVESNPNVHLDVMPRIFEYDVSSRPSLREVSSKADSDTQQDRVYTSDQRDDVIDKLNALRSDENVRKLLGPKLTKSIESYLHANGSFSKLDELLKVPSVGPKTVRTLCDKLLGITVEKSSKSRSASPISVRRTRSPSHFVSPPLNDEFCSSVNLLGAIIVDITSISWALVDSKKKTLLDWKVVPVDVPFSSLRDVVVQANAVEKELPIADLYVLEDPNFANRSGHHFKSHLTCALATTIYSLREATGGIKMAVIKNRLVEKHFNATVGTETVSLQPFIQAIIEQKVVVGRSNIFISQDLMKYYRGIDHVAREQLSRAALLSVTCMDLVLNKRDTLDRRKAGDNAE